MTSPTIELLSRRASVRSFLPDDIDDETMRVIIDAACRAPTSDNLQAYSLVAVRDPETRARLAELSGGQRHVAAAPVVIAVCADLSKVSAACELAGRPYQSSTVEMGLVAVVDASLVGMTASLAAESLGLGTVMIGGMRNHPLEIAALLGLPDRSFVLFGLCIGWPAEVLEPKPRLPLEAVYFSERHDAEATRRSLASHDATLAAHYRGRGRSVPDAAWTGRAAELGTSPRRGDLAEHLRLRDFPLR